MDYYTSSACIANNDNNSIVIKKDNANRVSIISRIISACCSKIRGLVKFINNRRALYKEYKYGGLIADAFLKEDDELRKESDEINYLLDKYEYSEPELKEHSETYQWINS